MAARDFAACGAALLWCALPAAVGAAPVVRESAREIPVAYQVDVVVVGGTGCRLQTGRKSGSRKD